jgi:hypothetical protein
VEEFLKQLTEEGYGEPVRSVYFFWVDRYIVENKELKKETLERFARGMVDGKFIHQCDVYDFSREHYILVCRFVLSLYEVMFFLPSREGYLSGKKYFMRIKGKLDLVSLRKLFKIFRLKLFTLTY